MRISILLFFVLPSAVLFAGKLPPLTIKDVSLMLRSGYSTEAVEREASVRRVIDSVDPATEKALLQAGATPAFVNSLRSGIYAVSPEEAAAVQRELAVREQRRAAQTQEGHKTPATQNAPASRPVLSNGPHKLASAIHGNLVTSKNGILQTFNNQALEKKKVIGLYFAARWCSYCRKFTPTLVEYYNRVGAAHPEVEIIFVSADRSLSAMETHMRDSQMPWPAVAYENAADLEALRKYAGSGIPCLVLIDADGKVISDSYEGKDYRGPTKVLADLDQLLGEKPTNQVARQ